MTTIAQTPLQAAQQRYQQAQERQRELDQQLQAIRRQRQAAVQAGDQAAAAALNDEIARLNGELRFALSVTEEARQQIDVEKNREQRARNQLASLSGEESRIAEQLAFHEERARELRPQLERCREQLAAAATQAEADQLLDAFTQGQG